MAQKLALCQQQLDASLKENAVLNQTLKVAIFWRYSSLDDIHNAPGDLSGETSFGKCAGS